jgi:hypothetical protein
MSSTNKPEAVPVAMPMLKGTPRHHARIIAT